MTDFNYLEGSLTEWADSFINVEVTVDEALAIVRDHYIPEFEAAIWKLAAANVTNA